MFVAGSCPGRSGMFQQHPQPLHPLDASRTPFLGGDDLEKTSPDLDQCPWQGEGTTSPLSQDLSHKDLRSVRNEIFVSLTVVSPAPTV